MASKGTAAKGKKIHKGRTHIRCPRCGKTAFHKRKKTCADCGYGKSAKFRRYRWNKKLRSKWSYRVK